MELAGLILIGPQGRVLASNIAGRAILGSGDGIGLEDGCLRMPGLHSLRGGLMRIDRPSGQTPYLVWETPLLNGAPTPSYRAVTIFDPALREQANLAMLQAAFPFTKAELRLAAEVIKGRKPDEAAEALGITVYTVRTYLKRLYNKVGVRTQAKLVRRLLEVVQSLPEAN